MYQTLDIDSKWPKLKQWQAVSLEKDNARESSEVSLAIIPYQNELHFMWGDRHLCRCNDITKILIPGLDKTKKKTMIAADNKCLWYMDGDDLSELTISDGQKKTARLQNWTSITKYDRKTMLYTVEHSSVVYSQDYPLVSKEKKPMTRALESNNCQAGAPLIKLENSVACTVAASGEGYIAVLASHKDRKQLSLYGDPNKTTHVTEVIYTEHSNWIQRAILMLAQWLSIAIEVVSGILVYCIFTLLMWYAILFLKELIHNQFGVKLVMSELNEVVKEHIYIVIATALAIITSSFMKKPENNTKRPKLKKRATGRLKLS